jgi:hypothetical protein
MILRIRLVVLVTANVPRSRILSTLKMEATHTSESSVLTRSTRCHIPEYGILHSHRRENLEPYIALTVGLYSRIAGFMDSAGYSAVSIVKSVLLPGVRAVTDERP